MTFNTSTKYYEKRDKIPEIYHGVPSFMGLPVAKQETALSNYDLAVLGVPWEGPIT